MVRARPASRGDGSDPRLIGTLVAVVFIWRAGGAAGEPVPAPSGGSPPASGAAPAPGPVPTPGDAPAPSPSPGSDPAGDQPTAPVCEDAGGNGCKTPDGKYEYIALNSDCYGNEIDYPPLTVQCVEECQRLCDERPDCAGVTYADMEGCNCMRKNATCDIPAGPCVGPFCFWRRQERPPEKADTAIIWIATLVPVLLLGGITTFVCMLLRRRRKLKQQEAIDAELGKGDVIGATNPHNFIHPSMWCITPQQLWEFMEEIHQLYPEEDPNAYKVVNDVIKPRTQGLNESYALMLNPEGVPVKHFITHAWAEGMKHFGSSLQAVGVSGGLWICFFANPQTWPCTELDRLLGANVWLSPFAVALEKADDVIAVRNPNVNMYTRLWCVFELFAAHHSGKDIRPVGPENKLEEFSKVGFRANCSVERDTNKLRAAMQEKALEVDCWVQRVLGSSESLTPNQKEEVVVQFHRAFSQES